METEDKRNEESYLDYVKLNIELEREHILQLLGDSAVGGAGPK